ncbi:MAG: TetR family transcriptional regulator [Solirubrobacterales bacterium]
MACELPLKHDRPLGRFSRTELHRLVIEQGVTEASASTIWRWLHDRSLKPWQQRSWIFPRDPDFQPKAGRVLDLYARRFEGRLLHPGEYVICADEKSQLQALARRHETVAPVPGCVPSFVPRPVRASPRAGRGCAAVRGFGELTVDDVCVEAGMSKGAFYGYFEHKQDLLLALLDNDATTLGDELVRITSGSASGAEQVRQFVQAMLARGAGSARVQVRADLWSELLTEPAVRRRLAEVTQRRRALVDRGNRRVGRVDRHPGERAGVDPALLALADGLMLHRALDSSAFQWRNISRAMNVLFAGTASRRGDGTTMRPVGEEVTPTERLTMKRRYARRPHPTVLGGGGAGLVAAAFRCMVLRGGRHG